MHKELRLLLLLVLAGCGENLDTTSPSTQVGPPENLKALSVNGTSVGLQWTPPSGPADSLGGYVVQWGAKRDTLGKTALSFVADSLTQVEKTFTVYSRRVSGALSDGAEIKWAPAARFDSPLVLYEYKTNVTTVESALDAGTATLNPSALSINSANAPRTDFYLYGGLGQVAQALELWSMNTLTAVWNTTYFSTVTHQSDGLDYYLASFPASSTFTLDHVTVTDNTIYYIKVVGDNGTNNYARIHVHLKAGASFPSRAVEIRVSLQRTPALLYASQKDPAVMQTKSLALMTLPGTQP